MSEHLRKIASSPRVTEWINPHDERLVRVTGLIPPVDAKSLREEWQIQRSEVPELLTEVKRILIPEILASKVKLTFGMSSFAPENTSGTVSIEFEDPEDWRQCLPATEQTLVFDRNGVRGNAAIALCGKEIGLAVISMDYYEEEALDLAVQPIRQEKLTQILATN